MDGVLHAARGRPIWVRVRGRVHSPEAAGLVVNGPREAAVRLRRQIGGERRQRLVQVAARIVGELDGDRLAGALGRGAVQRLDGALRLGALVEPNEADAFGQPWTGQGSILIRFTIHACSFGALGAAVTRAPPVRSYL